MTGLERRMNFEQEHADHERAVEFDRLVSEKLDELGGPWSIEKMTEAMRWAKLQQDPESGELKYELDDNTADEL